MSKTRRTFRLAPHRNPRAWRRWWRHPDRLLARRQFRRGVRVRWYWLVLLVLVTLPQGFLLPEDPSQSHALLRIPMFLIYFCMYLGLWVSSMQNDCLRFFRGERLEELRVTPIRAEDLIPALLLAPIGVGFVLLTIHGLCEFPYLIKIYGFELDSLVSEWATMRLLSPIFFLLNWSSGLVVHAGMTATVVALGQVSPASQV